MGLFSKSAGYVSNWEFTPRSMEAWSGGNFHSGERSDWCSSFKVGPCGGLGDEHHLIGSVLGKVGFPSSRRDRLMTLSHSRLRTS